MTCSSESSTKHWRALVSSDRRRREISGGIEAARVARARDDGMRSLQEQKYWSKFRKESIILYLKNHEDVLLCYEFCLMLSYLL